MTGVTFLRDVAKTLTVQLGFGVDLTTAVSSWVLTDVSTDVQFSTAIVIGRGRQDEQDQAGSPSSVQFTLLNDSLHGNGNYTPRRGQSIYYPNVKVGVPCKVLLHIGADFELFSGFVDSFAPAYDST